jgi:hypothetical protein
MPEQLEVEVEGEKLTLRRYQPGDRLRRVEAAEALTALGYPASYTMLANWAVQRIGPPYYKFGKYAIYKHDDLVAWADARLRRAAG